MLRNRAYSQKEMLDMGAGGHLSKGFLRHLPLDKLDGLEPTPSNNDSDDGLYHAGRAITDPIEVQYDATNDCYMVYAGNHRIAQARANGQTHILAFVEPDPAATGDYIGTHPKQFNPDASWADNLSNLIADSQSRPSGPNLFDMEFVRDLREGPNRDAPIPDFSRAGELTSSEIERALREIQQMKVASRIENDERCDVLPLKKNGAPSL